jgi:hypothetical protein
VRLALFMVIYTRHLGFPPADDAVRSFLMPCGTVEMQRQSYSCACHFLLSLFKHTKNKVIGLGGNNRKDRIVRFREYMTKGQKFGCVGDDRQIFYSAVAADAQKVLRILFIFILFQTIAFKGYERWGQKSERQIIARFI